MRISKVERAYSQLILLVEEGAEYPDAVFAVTDEFNLSDSQVTAVQRKYDTDPSGRAADVAREEQRAEDEVVFG
jgi:hypothetical protein